MSLSIKKDIDSGIFLLEHTDGYDLQKINKYLCNLGEGNKTSQTLRKNANSMKVYFQFIIANKYDYKEINKELIAEFIEYLNKSKEGKNATSAKYVNRILTVVKSFYCYIAESYNDQMLKNKLDEMDSSAFKIKETLRKSNKISINDAKNILESFTTWRDALIFKILYLTGLSITDVLTLKTDDIYYAKGNKNEIYIEKNNGSYARVYLQEKLMNELLKYIEEERTRFGNDNNFLFVNQMKPHCGKKVSYRAVHYSFNIVKEKLNMDFVFNDIRDSYFHNLIRENEIII